MTRILLLLVLLLGSILRAAGGSGPERSLERFEYKQYHMGVDVRIVVYARNSEAAVTACHAAFERFAELDDVMSDYRATSELMRLCARSGGPPVKVSRDLYKVLDRAIDVARRSDGAFDPTCGPLVALWRTARKTHELPPADEIAKARALVGWRNVRLDPRERTVELLTPGMKLDLGGIGKGFADDCAQVVLKRNGITRALVEAGGDIVVSGPPPGRAGWQIAAPNAGTGATPPVLSFANCAVSSSGDTEQFVEIGGKRYSHIVDPRTGMALTNRIGVTVVARDGLTSDGISKPLSILSEDRRRAFMRYYRGVTVYMRHRTD